ncbi:hypothetical protein T265_11774 [Opisthorchis viverrini]|uniref:Uncharacterized protein n=1 Tax=Opisthorchis viverrini TaxID=6198 RepID=A0A074Z1T6_OPIVI|nr:hypothetical protein T265_11774 [Opisthorchis viverrini]KER19457.1 hypothetical protein T265_11774 [Opisthorchis viverrini]
MQKLSPQNMRRSKDTNPQDSSNKVYFATHLDRTMKGQLGRYSFGIKHVEAANIPTFSLARKASQVTSSLSSGRDGNQLQMLCSLCCCSLSPPGTIVQRFKHLGWDPSLSFKQLT